MNSRVQPNRQYFKVIANSVQGLRAFLDELDTENTSVPVTLISALEKFIREIETKECNLIVLNNNSKIKLFKEWKSYSERCQNGEDEALNWEEKNSKPKSPGKHYKLLVLTSLKLQDHVKKNMSWPSEKASMFSNT